MYYDLLCRYLNLYTQDTAIIEDVLQEVFLKLWEDRDNTQISYIKTYLFKAAKNRVLNHLRDEQNRYRLLENWFNQQVEEQQHHECYDIESFVQVVNNAIDQLPAKCRDIFLLSRREQLTYKQIALQLNISTKTVETQMGIALKRIRDVVSTSSFVLFILFI